jgi:hypothetical protein
MAEKVLQIHLTRTLLTAYGNGTMIVRKDAVSNDTLQKLTKEFDEHALYHPIYSIS